MRRATAARPGQTRQNKNVGQKFKQIENWIFRFDIHSLAVLFFSPAYYSLSRAPAMSQSERDPRESTVIDRYSFTAACKRLPSIKLNQTRKKHN